MDVHFDLACADQASSQIKYDSDDHRPPGQDFGLRTQPESLPRLLYGRNLRLQYRLVEFQGEPEILQQVTNF